MFSYMSVAVLSACLIFSLLLLDSYIRVTKNTFVANTILSLKEKEFGFQEIKSIKLNKLSKTKNGKIVDSSFYEIEFNNGYTYDLNNRIMELEFEQQQKIVNHITSHSEVIVKENDTSL